MSKIVQAVNAMIANKKYITDVMPSRSNKDEYFFLYKGKYCWSILKSVDNDYKLFFYPKSNSISGLASIEDPTEWEFVPMVSYLNSEIATKEATSSFNELYQILKENIYGINSVLDDIISDLEF